MRLLGCLAAGLLATCAAITGRLLGGSRGAWSGGLVAAALTSSATIGGHMANGMVQGVALVTAACCAAVAATVRRPGALRLHGLSAVACALGASAVLVKQNLVGGLAFTGVVLLGSWLTGELPARRVLGALASGLGGVAAVVAATVAWAATAGVDLEMLWSALYEFPLEAAETISDASMAAPLDRLGSLLRAFLTTGLALVLLAFLAAVPGLVRDRGTRRYIAGVAAAPRPRWRGGSMRVATAVTVLAAVLGNTAGALDEREPRDQVRLARHLAAAAQPGDTAFVAYGNAEILLYSGLTSDYPHLWSLPMRVLDPELESLLADLRGPRPPTWVVQLGTFDAWGIDADGELAATVARRYRQVGEPCGFRIHLLRGVDRSLPPRDPCR